MTLAGLLVMVFLLLVLRQNLLVVLGCVAAYAYLIWGDGVLEYIVFDGWDALNRDVLLSIPLYLLAGNIMAGGAIAPRLVRLMRALTGPVPGGLAIATVLSCGLFAAIVGSSIVTLLAVGSCSKKWQATRWPGPASRSTGSSWVQRGCACGQRV